TSTALYTLSLHDALPIYAKLNPLDFNIKDGVTDSIGLPQISIGGGGVNFGGPAGFPQGRSDTNFVVSDTLNYLHGNHSLKFGGRSEEHTSELQSREKLVC